MASLTRRVALKFIGLGTAFFGLSSKVKAQFVMKIELPEQTVDRWAMTNDRVWLGEQFWANPMEDWKIVDGAAECQSLGPNRNIQLVTHELVDGQKPFEMSVHVRQVEVKGKAAGVGFRLGVQSDIQEYRSNCFSGAGLNAGIEVVS